MSNFEKFVATLPIMLQGMLGIFIVLFVIYMVIFALNRFTGRKQAAEDGSNSSAQSGSNAG